MFAFKFNLRLYMKAAKAAEAAAVKGFALVGRGLHSFPFELNSSLLSTV